MTFRQRGKPADASEQMGTHVVIRLASKILWWIFPTLPHMPSVLKVPTGEYWALVILSGVFKYLGLPRGSVSLSIPSGLFLKALVMWKSRICSEQPLLCKYHQRKFSFSPPIHLKFGRKKDLRTWYAIHLYSAFEFLH